MLVFVTGGTGFVGTHTVAALLDAGHDVRLAVRDEHKARQLFGADASRAECVATDICDPAAVAVAMSGCDAVFHAAATVSFDPRQASHTYDTNVGAVRAVLGTAGALGVSRIVYVSSLAVLVRPGASSVAESTPLAEAHEPYSRSKVDSERYVRALQEQGVPVGITYPSAVIGPDDPKLSAANRAMRTWVSRFVPVTTSGFQCVDVRDLAKAHVWLLDRPAAETNPRYVVGGRYYPWPELRRTLAEATERHIAGLPLPAPLLRVVGRAADAAQRVRPFATQISVESTTLATRWTPADSARFERVSGLRFRTGDETFRDTIGWMAAAGHLPRRFSAGRSAPRPH